MDMRELHRMVIAWLAVAILEATNKNRMQWSRVSKNGRALSCGRQDFETLFRQLQTGQFKGSVTLKLNRDTSGKIEWSL